MTMRLIDADEIIKCLEVMKVTDEKDKQSVRFAINVVNGSPTIYPVIKYKADYDCGDYAYYTGE